MIRFVDDMISEDVASKLANKVNIANMAGGILH